MLEAIIRIRDKIKRLIRIWPRKSMQRSGKLKLACVSGKSFISGLRSAAEVDGPGICEFTRFVRNGAVNGGRTFKLGTMVLFQTSENAISRASISASADISCSVLGILSSSSPIGNLLLSLARS